MRNDINNISKAHQIKCKENVENYLKISEWIIEKVNRAKGWYLESTNKLDKLLAKITKTKIE